ncbi:expressed protein, partial [Phakopsora pachyrhizi]
MLSWNFFNFFCIIAVSSALISITECSQGSDHLKTSGAQFKARDLSSAVTNTTEVLTANVTTASLVPGDMSSGQCMCPVTTTCAANSPSVQPPPPEPTPPPVANTGVDSKVIGHATLSGETFALVASVFAL